jgi:RNA polymerase subunit RPABC4/transcription elongation factor Spt4
MEKQCSNCKLMFPEEELLEREDTAELVCGDCSGLLAADEISCRYDEQG